MLCTFTLVSSFTLAIATCQCTVHISLLAPLPLLIKVLVRMKQYKDDLLVSCLQLLLSLPNELVEPEFANLVPALKVQKWFHVVLKESLKV